MSRGHDYSYKDGKYFTSGNTYNCPFCNRRNVCFEIDSMGSFHWDNRKSVFHFTIKCSDCGRKSFHLSEYSLLTKGNEFEMPPQVRKYEKIQTSSPNPTLPQPPLRPRVEVLQNNDGSEAELDDVFFFHQPTSYFTVDERIPARIREPFAEAENCMRSGFLTGASGALRKAVYKMLSIEDIPLKNDSGQDLPYSDRIDLLAKKFPRVESELFHDLRDIQGLTSQELHENDWEDFDHKTLKFLVEVTRQILNEIYVFPDERKKRRQMVVELRKAAKPLKLEAET